jgi:phage terminase large subunit GpA-like protein
MPSILPATAGALRTLALPCELRVRVVCVDSGGHHQHQVLTYCRNRGRRGVLPIKGIRRVR